MPNRQEKDLKAVKRAYELLKQNGLSVGFLEEEWIYEGEWLGEVAHYHFEDYGLEDVLEKVFGKEAKSA